MMNSPSQEQSNKRKATQGEGEEKPNKKPTNDASPEQMDTAIDTAPPPQFNLLPPPPAPPPLSFNRLSTPTPPPPQFKLLSPPALPPPLSINQSPIPFQHQFQKGLPQTPSPLPPFTQSPPPLSQIPAPMDTPSDTESDTESDTAIVTPPPSAAPAPPPTTEPMDTEIITAPSQAPNNKGLNYQSNDFKLMDDYKVFTNDSLHDHIYPLKIKIPSNLEDNMLGSVKNYFETNAEIKSKNGVNDLFKEKSTIFLRDVFNNGKDKKGTEYTMPPCFNSIFFDQAGHTHKQNLLKHNNIKLKELVNSGGYCKLDMGSKGGPNPLIAPALDSLNFTALFNCDLLMFYTIICDLYADNPGAEVMNTFSEGNKAIFQTLFFPPAPPAPPEPQQPVSYEAFLNNYKTLVILPPTSYKDIISEISVVCTNYLWQILLNYCFYALYKDKTFSSSQVYNPDDITNVFAVLKNIYFTDIDKIDTAPIAVFKGIDTRLKYHQIISMICKYLSQYPDRCDKNMHFGNSVNYNTSQQSLCILLLKKIKNIASALNCCGKPRGGDACKTLDKENCVNGIEQMAEKICDELGFTEKNKIISLIGPILKFAGDSSHITTYKYIQYALSKSGYDNTICLCLEERPLSVRGVHCGLNMIIDPTTVLMQYTYRGVKFDIKNTDHNYLYYTKNEKAELKAFYDKLQKMKVFFPTFMSDADIEKYNLSPSPSDVVGSLYNEYQLVKNGDNFKQLSDIMSTKETIDVLSTRRSDINMADLKKFKGIFAEVGRNYTILYRELCRQISNKDDKLLNIFSFFNDFITLKDKPQNLGLNDAINTLVYTVYIQINNQLPFFINNMIKEILFTYQSKDYLDYIKENKQGTVKFIKKSLFERGKEMFEYYKEKPVALKDIINRYIDDYINVKNKEIMDEISSIGSAASTNKNKEDTAFFITILFKSVNFIIGRDGFEFQPASGGGTIVEQSGGGLGDTLIYFANDVNTFVFNMLNNNNSPLYNLLLADGINIQHPKYIINNWDRIKELMQKSSADAVDAVDAAAAAAAAAMDAVAMDVSDVIDYHDNDNFDDLKNENLWKIDIDKYLGTIPPAAGQPTNRRDIILDDRIVKDNLETTNLYHKHNELKVDEYFICTLYFELIKKNVIQFDIKKFHSTENEVNRYTNTDDYDFINNKLFELWYLLWKNMSLMENITSIRTTGSPATLFNKVQNTYYSPLECFEITKRMLLGQNIDTGFIEIDDDKNFKLTGNPSPRGPGANYISNFFDEFIRPKSSNGDDRNVYYEDYSHIKELINEIMLKSIDIIYAAPAAPAAPAAVTAAVAARVVTAAAVTAALAVDTGLTYMKSILKISNKLYGIKPPHSGGNMNKTAKKICKKHKKNTKRKYKIKNKNKKLKSHKKIKKTKRNIKKTKRNIKKTKRNIKKN